MRIFDLCLTGLLTVYAVYSQKQYDNIKPVVLAAGFFSIAFYLDCIFCLIMRNAAAGHYPVAAGPDSIGADLGTAFQLMGILVCKSILVTSLTAWAVIRRKFAGDMAAGPEGPADREKAGGQNGNRYVESLRRSRGVCPAGERQGWQYLDGLTVGIAVFSVMLALECMMSGREDFAVVLRLFFLLFLLGGYYGSVSLYRKKICDRERKAAIEQQRGQANLYLRNVEEQYQRTRELWHDLKNHISLLGLLLQEGKYEEMTDYLRIFGDDIDSLTLPVKSGNLVVDALLADKVARAKKEGIRAELSLCDLTGLSLRPDEICSLLGNLLDNALEANRQVREGRFLSVECRERAECYYIKVQNAAADVGVGAADSGAMRRPGETRGQEADGLASPKTDRRNQVGHGLGLRSMERIVHACGGELAVERKEGRFTAVVRLPRAQR